VTEEGTIGGPPGQRLGKNCYPCRVAITSRRVAAGSGWQLNEYTCDSGPQDRPFEERHAWTSIALVVGGTFRYRTAQGSAVMAPGSLLLGNFGTCFECGHDHSRGDRCLSFKFAPEFFEPIAAVPGATRVDFAVPSLPPVPALMPVLADLQSVCSGAEAGDRPDGTPDPVPADSALEVATRLIGEVSSVLAGVDRAARSPSMRDERRIATVLRRIEERVHERLGLSDLARDAAMSPYHFLRTFEQLVGVTPGQYVLRTRLRRAAVGLRTSEAPIGVVALDSGFTDLSTFNRQFKRVMGVSPGGYRAR
jgi:AraC family transcriptional regulator